MLLAAPPHTTWRRSLALGALVFVQGLSSPYLAFATCAPLSVLAAYRVLRSETRDSGLRLLTSLAMASALSVPVYWGYARVERENPGLAAQTIYPMVGARPFVVPEDFFAGRHPTGLPVIAWLLIGVGILCLARPATAADRVHLREGWGHAALWAAVGMLLSLKPHVVVAGVPLTLPHVVLAPVFTALRDQRRIGVTALIACSILAGLAFAEVAARLPGRAPIGRVAAAAVIAGLILASYFRPIDAPEVHLAPQSPYPTRVAPVADAAIEHAIARSEGALLELPVCPNSFSHAAAMFRAIGHRRPLLNGYSGYYPVDFPARIGLACLLPDPEALAALVKTTDIGMILVHVNQLQLARRGYPQAPYRCPPADAPDAEAQAWRRAKSPGARRDMQLVATGRNGDLLFRVVR
jgi:hypothetical protein